MRLSFFGESLNLETIKYVSFQKILARNPTKQTHWHSSVSRTPATSMEFVVILINGRRYPTARVNATVVSNV